MPGAFDPTCGRGQDPEVPTAVGRDGTASARGGGPTTDFNCDIVFSQGRFFQWPEGTQS